MPIVETKATSFSDLFEGIAELSESELEPQEFFTELIGRADSLTAGQSYFVWDTTSGETTKLLLRRIGDKDEQSGQLIEALTQCPKHHSLLVQTIASRRCRIVTPKFSDASSQSANPLAQPLLLVTVTAGTDVDYLIELVLDASATLHAQRELLSLWEAIAGLAAGYVRSQKLRRQGEMIQWQSQAADYVNHINRSLEPLVVAMTIANEMRTLLKCDRVSVLTRKGEKSRVLAISGQAEINSRSNSITLLETLAKQTIRTKSDFNWALGDTEELPEQIEIPLQRYVDHSLVSSLHIHPLGVDNPSSGRDAQTVDDLVDYADASSKENQDIVGALVIENFSACDELNRTLTTSRVLRLSSASANAFANAKQHSSIFLLPLWLAIGRIWQAIGAKRSTAIVTGLAVVCVAACLITADFNLAVEGTLRPKNRRQIFAVDDGIVRNISVKHGQHVEAGQSVLTLENNLIENEILRVAGELHAAQKKLASIQSARIAGQVAAEQDHSYAIEEEALSVSIDNLTQQQTLLNKSREDLTLRSIMAGEVLTWNIQELLQDRPVVKGNALITVADTEGPWVLQLKMPDRRMGHLLSAQESHGEDLPVEFVLATEPDTRLQGKIESIAGSTAPSPDGSQSVMVTVSVDASQIKTLRPGAIANAKVYAGRRSIAFVWLHDAIEYAQSKILFRLW